MSMFKGKPKKQRVHGSPSVVTWGETFGSYGFEFQSEFDGPHSPGPLETSLSLRRVRHGGEPNGEEELQISIELRQNYTSGAASRAMTGGITLNREALADFVRLATEVLER